MMPTAAGVRCRVERLESAGPICAAPAVVIYLPGESDEERQARVPAGAGPVLFIPYNGRDPARAPAPLRADRLPTQAEARPAHQSEP